jgi:predicted PurR-regulated permease PerM
MVLKAALADQFATTCFSVNIRILKNLNFEMHVQKSAPILLHRILLFGLFFILLYLSFSVLKYFIVPVVWAIIIAYMTWPIYRWILKKCGEQRTNLSATLMLLLIILVIGVPFVFAIFILQNEGQQLFVEVQKQLFSGT